MTALTFLGAAIGAAIGNLLLWFVVLPLIERFWP